MSEWHLWTPLDYMMAMTIDLSPTTNLWSKRKIYKWYCMSPLQCWRNEMGKRCLRLVIYSWRLWKRDRCIKDCRINSIVLCIEYQCIWADYSRDWRVSCIVLCIVFKCFWTDFIKVWRMSYILLWIVYQCIWADWLQAVVFFNTL